MEKKFVPRYQFIIFILVSVILVGCLYFFCIRCIKKNNLVELKFRITWDEYSTRGEAIAAIVQNFNDTQDQIHVTMVGGNEERTSCLRALTDDVVDVYVMPYRFIHDSEIYGELYPLPDFFASESPYYYDVLFDLVETKNGVIGTPWIGHSMGLIFNKDLTGQAGVDPYEWVSVEDLLAACETVAEKTDAGGLGLVGADDHDLTWMLSQFIYTFGGRLVETDESGGREIVAINSEENKQAVDFYVYQLGAYAQYGWENDTGTEVMEAFGDGEIAFEIQGPWGISDIWKRGNPFEVGAISLEQIGMYSEIGPLMLSISKDSMHIEESKTFVRYLVDKQTLEKNHDRGI